LPTRHILGKKPPTSGEILYLKVTERGRGKKKHARLIWETLLPLLGSEKKKGEGSTRYYLTPNGLKQPADLRQKGKTKEFRNHREKEARGRNEPTNCLGCSWTVRPLRIKDGRFGESGKDEFVTLIGSPVCITRDLPPHHKIEKRRLFKEKKSDHNSWKNYAAPLTTDQIDELRHWRGQALALLSAASLRLRMQGGRSSPSVCQLLLRPTREMQSHANPALAVTEPKPVRKVCDGLA